MSTTYYSLYVQKVMALAKTLVIKSEATAEAINDDLTALGHTVESEQPETWKYYLNLNGQYHQTDTSMTVTSLDTLETIVFSKETLKTHRATAQNYAFGSRYYNDLVRMFPSQEMLILGILNPVDLTTAIEAPDNKILYSNAELVEPQETNLIEKLQGAIDRFMVRWNVPAYTITDALYTPAQLGVMYLQIPSWILNIRLENCRTQYAHGFHIREYLASHGRLDKHFDFMTIKQQLWLYRNLLYIENNVGKQETFEWLVENILTDRNIPLAQYDMRHNLEDMPTDIRPSVEFKRSAVNRHYSPGVSETRPLSVVLEDENGLARRNAEVYDDAYAEITHEFTTSPITQVPTKVLDSSITDMTDSGAITLTDFLMNHWLYWSTIDRYPSVLTITHPRTGVLFQLPTRDAFAVFLYSYNKSMGQTLDRIPDIMAKEVRKITVPKATDLWKLVERKYVTEDHLSAALDDNSRVSSYISVEAFRDAVNVIYDRALNHRYLYVVEEDQHTRAQVQAVVDHFYMDIPVTLVPSNENRNYLQWFDDKGYNLEDLSTLEYELLANTIVEEAIGVDLDNRLSLKEMQASMLKLMGQLSSYSVQYIQNINSGPILVADDPTQRMGDEWVTGLGRWRVDASMAGVMDMWVKERQTWTIDPDSIHEVDLYLKTFRSDELEIGVEYSTAAKSNYFTRTEGPQVTFNITGPDPDFTHIVIV